MTEHDHDHSKCLAAAPMMRLEADRDGVVRFATDGETNPRLLAAILRKVAEGMDEEADRLGAPEAPGVLGRTKIVKGKEEADAEIAKYRAGLASRNANLN